jgi:hypothetical protein
MVLLEASSSSSFPPDYPKLADYPDEEIDHLIHRP